MELVGEESEVGGEMRGRCGEERRVEERKGKEEEKGCWMNIRIAGMIHKILS